MRLTPCVAVERRRLVHYHEQEDDCGRTSWTGDIDVATLYYGFELPGKALPDAPTAGGQVSWVSLEIALATERPEPALLAERG